MSNLTWLQLYQLKLEFGASWNAAARWVTLLFPGRPSLNARHQMERAAFGFGKTDHKEAYIALTVNLDSIGPFCTGLGIFRSTVADGDPIPSVRGELGNGAILELVALYVPAHEILNCLFPDISADGKRTSTRSGYRRRGWNRKTLRNLGNIWLRKLQLRVFLFGITIQLFAYIYGNDSNKVIIYRTGRLRESDVQAHPWPRRENGNLRGRWRFFWSPFSPMLIVWEYNFVSTFIIFIRHRTERAISATYHVVLRIFYSGIGGLALYRVFFVKAELRKFGEVRSHPPHPPWVRHWNLCSERPTSSGNRELRLLGQWKQQLSPFISAGLV